MREIRPYGSVRGVRRKPYPYRDTPHPVQSTALEVTRYSAEIADASAMALRRLMRFRPLKPSGKITSGLNIAPVSLTGLLGGMRKM
jgi:hypothetical protein